MKKRLIAAVSDLLVAALLLGGIYGVNYLIPQKGVSARNMTQIAENKESKNQNAQQDKLQCSICQSKQILLNCLATLKDSPFKQSHIASLQSLNLPLLEVFIQMFLAELERLIHRGLKSDYREIAQNRAFLKGKLLFNEQITYNLIHK